MSSTPTDSFQEANREEVEDYELLESGITITINRHVFLFDAFQANELGNLLICLAKVILDPPERKTD